MENRFLKRMGSCLVSAGIIMQFGVSSLAYGAADQGVAVNEQNFPDGVFRSYVSDNFDEDGDGYLCDEELVDADTIEYSGYRRLEKIADLTGIEFLPYLTTIHINDCDLTTVDLSENTALEILDLRKNHLTELDVSNNTSLTYVCVDSNMLEEIDVSNNTALECLTCASNNISDMDLSSNTSISILSVEHNPLTELTLGNSTELYYLNCMDTDLSELNISSVPLILQAYTDGECCGAGFISIDTLDSGSYYEYYYDNDGTYEAFYVDDDVTIITAAEEVDPEPEEEPISCLTSFDVSHGVHWDSSVAPYGANVADTTITGNITFDAPVQSFTISVDGQIANDACNSLDWRYSITNNQDGTYTVSYTANQYEYNPPVSCIDGLSFTVNGDEAPVITVVEYTLY